MRRRLAHRLLPTLLLVSGCSLLTDAPPAVESVELLEGGPLVQPLRVTLAKAAPLEVRYWSDGGPVLGPRAGPGTIIHERSLRRVSGREGSVGSGRRFAVPAGASEDA